MAHIQSIHAREILDSRGFPTVEAEITLDSGFIATASVPSGASTGSKEALELRDHEERYMGKGTKQAVLHVNQTMQPVLVKQQFNSQRDFDQALLNLDNTDNKSTLGANSILAASLAFARALAHERDLLLFQSIATDFDGQLTLPVPMLNILNGGAHADNNVDIQEFMVMPVGANDWPSALQMGVEIYHALKTVLKKNNLSTTVGDEGGFAPNLRSNQEALDMIMAAVEVAGFKAGTDVYLALDVAANELFEGGHYHFRSEQKQYTAEELTDVYLNWARAYPILSIEDAMAEDDNDGWLHLTKQLGQQMQLVGDDVFVTNPKLLAEGISKDIANAILIKPNQIGTLTETLDTIQMAKKAQYQTVISHRSGETDDAFIADLAVGSNAGQIKTGAPARVDRVAKYNQLTRIFDGNNYNYAGEKVFERWLKR